MPKKYYSNHSAYDQPHKHIQQMTRTLSFGLPSRLFWRRGKNLLCYSNLRITNTDVQFGLEGNETRLGLGTSVQSRNRFILSHVMFRVKSVCYCRETVEWRPGVGV